MSNIKLFESKHIRSIWDDKTQRWFFAVVDVVAALSESQNPQVYWRVLKKRLLADGNETVTNCNALKMTAPNGKQRLTDVADTEQLLRLTQSIPSPKAEPFKRWLAKVGYERLEEIENPELAAARMRELYKAKGYSNEWIVKRVRGIAIRDELTNEWKKRGVKEQREYSILTAEISRATFGITPADYKELKSLDKPADNLRDQMNDIVNAESCRMGTKSVSSQNNSSSLP
jgi:prophage antirepressor-like protein